MNKPQWLARRPGGGAGPGIFWSLGEFDDLGSQSRYSRSVEVAGRRAQPLAAQTLVIRESLFFGSVGSQMASSRSCMPAAAGQRGAVSARWCPAAMLRLASAGSPGGVAALRVTLRDPCVHREQPAAAEFYSRGLLVPAHVGRRAPDGVTTSRAARPA